MRGIICYFCVKVMQKDSFSFKQFTIRQDRCAMKVGTDGVLLGAWAQCPPWVEMVLDVGSGTGVVALMMAQRFPAQRVVGVDLDLDATLQASENARYSPFDARVCVSNLDVRNIRGKWGCIVCNPPFYTEDTCSPDAARAMARSAQTLTFEELWQCVDRLLLPDGLFNVIIPAREYVGFHCSAIALGFGLERCTLVRTTAKKDPKRVLLCYRRGAVECTMRDEIVLTQSDGSRSPQLQELTKDFYL